MRRKASLLETPSERLVAVIRRATRKQYTVEEKIHIVLDGLRGEERIASWIKPVLDDINNYACRCRHEIEVATHPNPLSALPRTIRQSVPVASLDHNILAPRNTLTNAILFCNSRR